MSKKIKLLDRFKNKPSDFRWEELVRLLKQFGYEVDNVGKTSGSRVRFFHEKYPPIMLHKPHPTPTLKKYQIELIYSQLKEEKLI